MYDDIIRLHVARSCTSSADSPFSLFDFIPHSVQPSSLRSSCLPSPLYFHFHRPSSASLCHCSNVGSKQDDVLCMSPALFCPARKRSLSLWTQMQTYFGRCTHSRRCPWRSSSSMQRGRWRPADKPCLAHTTASSTASPCSPQTTKVCMFDSQSVECGSSAVECHTCDRVSPVSNPLFATVSKIGNFDLSTTPQFTQLYKWIPEYRQWWKCESSRVIAAWLECFPEKSSWCRNEQVCQWVKCKAVWAVRWTGYCYI